MQTRAKLLSVKPVAALHITCNARRLPLLQPCNNARRRGPELFAGLVAPMPLICYKSAYLRHCFRHVLVTQPDLLTSIDALEQHYGAPKQSSQSKISPRLTQAMQTWLSASSFFILSTYSEDGIDCSPRGDKPSEAVRILDENTIAVPDRRGNNRIDTLRNLINDPRVGLIFMVPGIDEALRIKGTAAISINQTLINSFTSNNESPPATVVLINVIAAYVQNARAIRSARLWETVSHADPDELPNAATLSANTRTQDPQP